MNPESTGFIAVFNKYILYSEAMSQYYRLEEEDQKIIEPYIRHLKELWQEELQHIKLKLKGLSGDKTLLNSKRPVIER